MSLWRALIRPRFARPPSPAKPVEDGRSSNALRGRRVSPPRPLAGEGRGEGKPHARERRLFAIVGALVFVLGLGGPAAWNAYVVRAVAPGLYVYPPATAEDMYRPDRFGRTAFSAIEVTAK